MIMCVFLCLIKSKALSNYFVKMHVKQIGTYILFNFPYIHDRFPIFDLPKYKPLCIQ